MDWKGFFRPTKGKIILVLIIFLLSCVGDIIVNSYLGGRTIHASMWSQSSSETRNFISFPPGYLYRSYRSYPFPKGSEEQADWSMYIDIAYKLTISESNSLFKPLLFIYKYAYLVYIPYWYLLSCIVIYLCKKIKKGYK